jgi:hypothetical protein
MDYITREPIPFKIRIIGRGEQLIINTNTLETFGPYYNIYETLKTVKEMKKDYLEDELQRDINRKYEIIDNDPECEIQDETRYEESDKIESFKYLDKYKDEYITVYINKERTEMIQDRLSVIDFIRIAMEEEGNEDERTEEYKEELKERWETYQKYKY